MNKLIFIFAVAILSSASSFAAQSQGLKYQCYNERNEPKALLTSNLSETLGKLSVGDQPMLNVQMVRVNEKGIMVYDLNLTSDSGTQVGTIKQLGESTELHLGDTPLWCSITAF